MIRCKVCHRPARRGNVARNEAHIRQCQERAEAAVERACADEAAQR